jgi:hypothetical protein
MNEPTSPRRTSEGKPITDETIKRLADEAEAGYDVTELRRRGGPPADGLRAG